MHLRGTRRSGQPDAADLAARDAIRSFDHVEALALRIVDPDVRTWHELFRGIDPGKEQPHAGAYEPEAAAGESMVAEA